jgi:hypothetical protein
MPPSLWTPFTKTLSMDLLQIGAANKGHSRFSMLQSEGSHASNARVGKTSSVRRDAWTGEVN